MKVYLDDMRPVPEGYVLAKTYDECIHLLRSNNVTHLSLDHDLGTDKTGYDVILWIEKNVAYNKYAPPEINVHSANTSAARKMWQGVHSIERMSQ